jgi:MFS family permease
MKKWGALITLSLAMFIIVIDTTIMNVSISPLVEDLNMTVSGVQAAISIYALVMAAFILIGGKLANIVSRKRIFVIGLIIYGADRGFSGRDSLADLWLFVRAGGRTKPAKTEAREVRDDRRSPGVGSAVTVWY